MSQFNTPLVYPLCRHIKSTSKLYTLSLHDALPISLKRWASRSKGSANRPDHAFGAPAAAGSSSCCMEAAAMAKCGAVASIDRKSTRLNSSHVASSYAVFCLKKKTQETFAYKCHKRP